LAVYIIFYLIFFFIYREEIYCDNKTESAIAGGNEIPAAVRSRVRPHFRFGSEIWNWKIEVKISFRLEAKKDWFHMIHFYAKHQKSEAQTKVK